MKGVEEFEGASHLRSLLLTRMDGEGSMVYLGRTTFSHPTRSRAVQAHHAASTTYSQPLAHSWTIFS